MGQFCECARRYDSIEMCPKCTYLVPDIALLTLDSVRLRDVENAARALLASWDWPRDPEHDAKRLKLQAAFRETIEAAPEYKSEKCGSLCMACRALPESASPSECICHWCLIRGHQESYRKLVAEKQEAVAIAHEETMALMRRNEQLTAEIERLKAGLPDA